MTKRRGVLLALICSFVIGGALFLHLKYPDFDRKEPPQTATTSSAQVIADLPALAALPTGRPTLLTDLVYGGKPCVQRCLTGALASDTVQRALEHKGYVCIGCPNVTTSIIGPLKISGVTRDGAVEFENVTFSNDVLFAKSNFKESVSISDCRLNEHMSFTDSVFTDLSLDSIALGLAADISIDPLSVSSLEVSDLSSPERSKLLDWGTHIKGLPETPALTVLTHNTGQTELNNLELWRLRLVGELNGPVTLSSIKTKELTFGYKDALTHFASQVFIEEFDSNKVVIDRAVFDSDLDFRKGMVGAFSMDLTNLKEGIYIGGVSFAGDFAVTNSYTKYLSFVAAKDEMTGKLLRTEFGPGSTIRLARFDFGETNLPWGTIKDRAELSPDMFRRLEENYLRMRQYDAADDLYIRRKDDEAKQSPWPKRLVLETFGWIAGYGIWPLRVLLCSFGLVLVFSYAYCSGRAIHNDELSHPRRSIWRQSFIWRVWGAFMFSLNAFLPIPFVGGRPTSHRCFIRLRLWNLRVTVPLCEFKTIALIEKALGWLLSTLFVVTLTKYVIR
jgi:hypothetical protein